MPEPRLDLDLIATLRDPTRRRLYDYVARQPRAVSRDGAAEAIGINRALAAFHLDRLVVAGLLKAEYRRLSGRSGPGAGRTAKLYRRSKREFELTVPHREHELLARLLADSFTADARVDEDVVTDGRVRPAHEYGRMLGARARRRLRRPAQARLVQCVADVVESLGFEPYRSSPAEVRLRNCPFHPLSKVYTALVCGVGQAVLRGVVEGVGADGVSVGRMERADECCGLLTQTRSD